MAAVRDFRAHVRSRISEALRVAGLPQPEGGEADIVLELPKDFGHGDLACPLPFSLARTARMPPRNIAEAIRKALPPDPLVDRYEVAGGGYLNAFLGGAVWKELLADVLHDGDRYGNSSVLAGQRFLVEFVSANPTGPLVVANARAAAFGEALCRCLEAAGAAVDREYYVNDAGSQVRNLARSVEARWRELRGEPASIPEDGYHGDYVRDLAARARDSLTDEILGRPESERLDLIGEFAVATMVGGHQAELERLRIRYARWFRERALHEGGEVRRALEDLKAAGVIVERDGAEWLATTRAGDEKDRVLIRSDGAPTYTLPDIAYHRDKFARGVSRAIDIVGADHQTEMATLRTGLAMLGEPVDRLEVIIVQFVNLKRGTEKVVMSKRSGHVVMLKDLVDEIGVDAARFFFLLRGPASHLDFDLDLARSTTLDNPVYYIQYAHARLRSLLEAARSRGFEAPTGRDLDEGALDEVETRQVLRKLARFPLVVEKAALTRSPHVLTHEVLELAQAVHQFYTRYRVLDAEEPSKTPPRLALMAAARQVVANGLSLLGVSVPDRM